MEEKLLKDQDKLAGSFQAVFENENLFKSIIEFFPHPINVYSKDGTLVMLNQAMLKTFGLESADVVVGKYNVLKDPSIENLGLIETTRQCFLGETFSLTDIKVPIEDVIKRYGVRDYDVMALYQDIIGFPILDDNKKVAYVVIVIINKRIYRGKDEVIKAKQYIENNWLEEFDISKVGKSANLSTSHLTRLFKKHTGITPYNYYISCKIQKLKEKLLDENVTVTEAFSSCGLSYNGHFARVFKTKVGLTPSDFRKMYAKK